MRAHPVINTVLNSLKAGSKKRLYIFLVLSVAIGLVIFLLAWKLAPWYYAINTPVRLYLDAPASRNISICWDKTQIQCLPLVPHSTTKNKVAVPGEIADLWLSELPPRPVYSISLIFTSGIKEAVFHELVLDSNILLFGHIQGAGINNLHFSADEFVPNKISSTLGSALDYLDGDKGGRLILNREIYPGRSNVSRNELTTITIIWGLLFSIYLLASIPLYLLPYTILNSSSALKSARGGSRYSRWTFMLFGCAVVLMPLLVVSSGVMFNEYDPWNYLYLTLSRTFFSDGRLPGYPLFLGLTLWMSGYHLSGVILLQAILLAFSVMVCVWTLKRWLPQFAAIVFVLLCLFSPAQIHWARWILRESLFTSLVLLGVTATIAHFTSRKHLSHIWMFVFAMACGLAFLVRENGIILPVVLLPALVPQTVRLLLSSGAMWERVRSVLLLASRYVGPVVCLAIIYAGFGGYNYLHYGYFQIGIHQTSHSFLVKAIYPGNSDARGLLDPDYAVNKESKSYLGWSLYRSFILARNQTPGLDPVYMSLYPYVNQHMAEGGEPHNTFHLASILNGIGKGMNNLVPWKAELAGILRQYNETIPFSTGAFFPRLVKNSYATASDQELLNLLPMKIKLDGSTGANSILRAYYNLTQGYEWYGLILIFATLSSFYILKNDDPVFLAPMAFFIGNCILLIFMRLVEQRYLINLDVLLILQMMLGLGSWMNRNQRAGRIPPRSV